MSEADLPPPEVMRAIEPYADAFRLVMLAEEGSGGRRATGTAIVVADGTTRFVITAAHVVAGPERRFFGVAGDDSVPWPSRYSKLVPLHDDLPDADVAWARAKVLPSDTALASAIPLALARAAIPDSSGSSYLAVGFPYSKSKVRLSLGVVASKLMVAVVELAPVATRSALGLNERVQAAFSYSQESRLGPDRMPIVGSHPIGMSGGAVFAIMQATTKGDQETSYLPFLVGILTQYHEAHGALRVHRRPERGILLLLWQRAILEHERRNAECVEVLRDLRAFEIHRELREAAAG